MEKITTNQAIKLLKLLKVMGLRNSLSSLFKSMQKLENKKQFILNKLKLKVEDGQEITNELVIKLFSDDKELHDEYKKCEDEQLENSLEFIMDVIEALPVAEKEFYKTMGLIFDKTAKEIEDEDVVITIQNVIEIFKSPTFMGFFNLMNS